MKKLLALMLTIFVPFIYSQYIGENWIEQNPGVNCNLNCIEIDYVYSYDIVWTCGDNGVVLRTFTNCDNWVDAHANIPGNAQLNSICLTDSAVLIAGNVGNDTYVYRSIDTGKSWQTVFSQPGGRINAVKNDSYYPDLYMVGNPVGGRWSVWKSTNYGINWDSTGMYLPQSGSEKGIPNSICLSNFNWQIWFGTDNKKIYHSPDGGYNWQTIYFPEQNAYFISIFRDKGHSAGNNLLVTTNGGNSWQASYTLGTGPIKSYLYYETPYMPSGQLFYTWYIRNNKIYFSGDKGSSWRVEHTSARGNYTCMTNNRYFLYAVTDAGIISKALGGMGTEIYSPKSFRIMQNFPNPFNSSTIIKVMVFMGRNLKINVYNSAGQLVTNLFNGKACVQTFSPNYFFYEAIWDGTNYPSGIYFYHVVDDDYQETGKMILVK